MSKFTVDQLKRVIQDSAGKDETVDWDGDLLDTPFEELGYDSLALLEAASRVERQFGAKIADEMVPELRTPREFVEHVNRILGATGVTA